MLQFKIFFAPSVLLFVLFYSVYILHSTQRSVSHFVSQNQITEILRYPNDTENIKMREILRGMV